ncbi:MAG TPA: cupin domain-containing protein [Acidimicrobiales bacterium]|nr:cupin domain-containing protein [Acidimicrobiales bacterium]
MGDEPSGLVHIQPGDGEVIAGATSGTVYKVTGEVTNGVYSVVESTIEPGVLQPPHTHSREDHLFLVTEGEVGFRVGDDEILAGPGSYVFMPRNIPHAFWNAGSVQGKMVQVNEPAKFESFFRDFYELTKDGPPDPAKAGALMAEYGITFLPEWIPEIEAKYGVKGH